MGFIEVLFDPETGGTERVAESLSSGALGDRWKIICEDDAVSILADKGDGKVRLIGAGRWTGKGIGQRYATGDPIDQSSWGKIEHALRCAFADPAAAAAAAAAELAVASAQRPPATADPAEEGYIELIVELASGNILYQRRSRTDRRAANGFEWKVVVAGERVTVHASDEVSCASATWDGERLTDREVSSKQRTINDYQWGVVEKAVIEVITGRPAPMPPPMSSGVAAGSAVELEAPRAPGAPGKDRRSGWWALAAAGVALAGTIVSWQAMPPGDGVALAVTIALAVVTLGLVIYGGIGLGTRCPSCRAWYRRKTTSTDVLGTSTVSRTISKPVYDSSGKQTGTTSELATYERTDYRYHYRCKECAHQWTGTGSSERRIS